MKKRSIDALFYNLFTSGYRTDDQMLVRRLILLNAFLMIGTATFALFFVVNLLFSNLMMTASIDFAAALFFGAALIDLRKRRREEQTALLATLVLGAFMIAFMLLNRNLYFGLIWTIFMPIFAIYLFGHNKGLRFVVPYYLLLYAIGYYGIGTWNDPQWNGIALARFVFSSIILVFVIYVSEYAFDKLQKELNRLSVTDPLTQLYNRRKIQEIFGEEVRRLQRYGRPLTVALLDIDDFKQINDRFGHPAGDAVLRRFAIYLKAGLRTTDALGRWGGEEFIIIFPQTALKDAMQSLERLRAVLAETEFEGIGKVRSSYGVCTATASHISEHDIISCADHALYDAKRSGKDRIHAVELDS